MKFRFVIILFSIFLISTGCQTIKKKSDEVAEKEGEWDNSPDEQHQDTAYMQNDLAGGLNRQKKSYPKVAGGDNPMALEDEIKAELQARLSEVMKEGKGKEMALPSGKETKDLFQQKLMNYYFVIV